MTQKTFADLSISPDVLRALSDLGFEIPTLIQEQSIPVFNQGKDILAQAQTGTGKTAAFALPILSKLSLSRRSPQAIIITPTRELAIQVSEAFVSFAKYMPDFHVLPIYGGQAFSTQLRALKRGVHVIVGTPGRIMDHLRRGSLSLNGIKTVVLDEADEMLKMGFIDDVKWILEQIKDDHQTALFSATIPESIRRVVKDYLHDAVEIKITAKTSTVEAITQYYTIVTRNNKLDILTRFLEIENFEAAIIFTRTKIGSDELSQKLEARGYSCAAINGDMRQEARENVIKRLKQGTLDIVVATEVAARGLDVDRLSHVINFDVPSNAESYTHRIGRTGRAGREGTSLVFIAPKERWMLRDIERMTKQPILELNPPTVNQVNDKRREDFAAKIIEVIKSAELDYFRELIEKIAHQTESSELNIAAALAHIAYQDKAAIYVEEASEPESSSKPSRKFEDRGSYGKRSGRDAKPRGDKPFRGSRDEKFKGSKEDKSFGKRAKRAAPGNFSSSKSAPGGQKSFSADSTRKFKKFKKKD